MSKEEAKAIVRRFAEVIFDGKALDRADEVALPEYVDHGAMPGQAPGLEGAKRKWAMWAGGCPDLRVSTQELFSEGDLVALRWHADGTHSGPLLGLAASGKHFHFDGMSIFRVADGKVAEQWEAWDKLDLLQQLGGASSAAAPTLAPAH
jgi:predicted ester cyclase